MRKGLATLVCLTLVAVVWAWAATAYSTYWVETKTTTLGGSIEVANNTALSGVGAIRFTSFTTANAVPVTVTPDSGYKISTVTVDNVAQTVPATGAYTYNGLQTPDHTVKIVAGFVGANAATSAAKTWQLQLQNGSAGGTISGAGHTLTTYGMKMYNFSDTTAIPVTVTPATGFYVSSLYVNSVLQSSFPTTGGTYTVDPSQTGKVFNVTANYKKQVNVVTTNTSSPLAANGILPVNPKVAYGNDVKLIVAPMAPYNTVTAISVTGSTYTAISMVDSQGNTAAPFKGSVVVTISNVTGPLNISYAAGTDNTGQMGGCTNTCHLSASAAVQAVPAQWGASLHKANAIDCVTCHQTMPGPVLTSANNCETCHGGGDKQGAPTVNFLNGVHWTNQMNTFTNATTANAYLISVEGPNGPDVGQWSMDCTNNCHFKPTTVGKDACLACHNQHRPETGLPADATAPNAIFFAYSTLPSSGTVPGVDANGNPTTESLQFGYWRHDTGCVKCHHQGNGEGNAPNLLDNSDFPAAPHFDATGTGVAFMNAGNTCATCHGHNNSINVDYGQSAHGDVTSSAWAEGGSGTPCVRCHTTQGFINYSTFKVVTPIAATKSVLSCNGCHTSTDMAYSPFGNLTTVNGVTGSLRKIAAYPAVYTQSGSANVSFQFPDVGPSNLCIPCHSGRVSGKNIQGLTSNMANTGFKNSHYKAAAGILYKSVGFEFYTSTSNPMYTDPATNTVYFEHSLIGSTGANADGVTAPGTGSLGPCVGCHLLNGPGHTLKIFTRDTTGAVTAINNTICVGCHAGDPGALDFSTDLTQLNGQINGFQASLGALQALLQSKGIYYNSAVYPYFFKDASYNTTTGTTSDWTLGTNDNAQGKMNMGAAFNLNLLTREPGAYAHNRFYAKRLIFDAIDWLQNGSLTGTIDVTQIQQIPAFDANAAADYLGTTRP
ncbi:cytochrome c3 family protein [Geomonas sp. Red32]|uniref:cytochrome c3 family protein n=1 Tax=Geomonas sp. Red32 TaxID=2912856 RepID=UPI00202CE325|nr:cytochrome c3 family protein [Geomonas sp. Red32]MCM0083568.1 cytochrome c3 family protein [Geomonas sp. Red32]